MLPVPNAKYQLQYVQNSSGNGTFFVMTIKAKFQGQMFSKIWNTRALVYLNFN